MAEVRAQAGKHEPDDHAIGRSRGGRPTKFDQARYQQRNVVERGFSWFKQWRGLATRADKLAINYTGGITLKATLDWLT